MKFTLKTFQELTTEELYLLLKARAEVFVVEQQCAYQDLDDLDFDSLHLFCREEGRIKAYLRLFYRDKAAGIVQIGRVLTTERGIGLGGLLLKEGIRVARDRMKAGKLVLEAQSYAIGYYECGGFQVCSEEFLTDGIPHVRMERQL